MVNAQETRIIIDFFNNLCKTKNAGKYRNSDKMFKCASSRQLINLKAKLISENLAFNNNECIDLTNKRVVFFDLDNTLIINNESHETRAIQLLSQLAEKGKMLVLVTYNQCPEFRLSKYNFDNGLFERIYKPELVMCGGKLIDIIYPPKSTSIHEFLEKTNILKDDAIFFDDLFQNIIGVRAIGVESVHVDCQGIPFDKLKF